MNKYYNDAIIGNKNMTASFTKNGELLRLMYPTTDYKQFVDFLYTGIKVNASNMIWLHDDPNNTYKQYYTEDTNVLNTEITNQYFKLKIKCTDFVPINTNVLVKKYVFKNENNVDLKVDFLLYSKILSNHNNQASGYFKENSLIQYTHDYNFCIFSSQKPLSHQMNNSKYNISSGEIGGKDYVGLSPDSSISYAVDTIKPGEEKQLNIFIYIQENNIKTNIEETLSNISKVKKMLVEQELTKAVKYWRKYVNEHRAVETQNAIIDKIQNRSILLFPLLTNQATGGISAAMEIDENMTKCGRYSYCWPRDAVFITKALDILKMEKETEKFYKNFCKNTQLKNGMWEQRFYTDGRFAPSWGYQIDETASIIFGVWERYSNTKEKDIKFLKDNFKMCELAIRFLLEYIEDVISEQNNMQESYDLWEMFEGTHTYSLASIYGAFDAIFKIYDELKDLYANNRLKQSKMITNIKTIKKYMVEIKGYIIKNLYSNESKCFVRNQKDKKIDISLLGIVTPFNMFNAKEIKVKNTIDKIDLSLRTYTGGYKRFEGDNYAGGNPWPIANLWMSLYYIEAKDYKKAKECFDFVTKSCNEHGFLGEQVDNQTMKPSWVIGLGWSHAMYIVVLDKLSKLKI